VAREPDPLRVDHVDGLFDGRTDGFPVTYASMGRFGTEPGIKRVGISIMEDGKVGVVILRHPDPLRGLPQQILQATFIERGVFDIWLATLVQWWEQEKAEPLVEVYKRRYGQIAAELDGDGDGSDR